MKRPSTTKRRYRAGFSLLEMVIVLGIIAVIIGGAISVMGRVGDGAKRTRVSGDFQAVGAALRMYQTNNGRYPTTSQGLDALVNKPSGTPVPKRWVKLMDEVPLDPWQEPYGYKFPGTHDPTTFEIISKGPDMTEGTEDDISSQKDE
ncbi:type II secretion system major pseudopilin GspG [Haloferula rosea]|uniref:Type II secretion system core protein G n=1 Tax=Haloferula rosea TaxID=490093 RepID=A0A934VFT7_9BACT|nr:type II secretion system major pseudopilin GspG [Haloferula rosea]MBK1827386.1 type II secretion system major pseudopilin GspG [Haloferula rosea]